jgi:lipoprotein-anchoring transpeptidase ErfK/SrfK
VNVALILRERAAHRVLSTNPLRRQKFHRRNVKGGALDSIGLRLSRAEPQGRGRVGYLEHRYDAHHRTGRPMANESAANRRQPLRTTGALMLAGALLVAPAMFSSTASAQVLSYAPSLTLAPAEPALTNRGDESSSALSERLRRTVVGLNTREAPGTVIIDTGNTALYYVLGQNRAIRYGVGVGREGFTWAGTQTITRKAEWPDWHPPAQMIARQPYLPRFMAGGPGNPLGARAMYLGSSEYRIHGTNDPSTIGKFVSSGCIRLTNEDVADLFSRVEVGTRVVVLAKNAPHLEASAAPNVRPASTAPRPIATTPAAGRQAMNLSMPSSY